MKKEQLNPVTLPADERSLYIRSMILNFRSRTISSVEHDRISEWLQESDSNQQLFEKWIFGSPRISPELPLLSGRGGVRPVRYRTAGTSSLTKKVLLIVAFLLLAALLFAVLF